MLLTERLKVQRAPKAGKRKHVHRGELLHAIQRRMATCAQIRDANATASRGDLVDAFMATSPAAGVEASLQGQTEHAQKTSVLY